MSTSIYELFHYSLFPGLFVAFTYNKKEPPVFGAAPAFWCILLSFLGLPFRHIPNNLSNDNELTANAPFFYQISGTWSNHEGSILSWCRILSFYGFLLCYRGRPQSHNVSKRGGHRESLFYSFVSNFVKNSILSLRDSLPSYEQKTGATTQLYTPFVLRTLVDSELRSLMLSPEPAGESIAFGPAHKPFQKYFFRVSSRINSRRLVPESGRCPGTGEIPLVLFRPGILLPVVDTGESIKVVKSRTEDGKWGGSRRKTPHRLEWPPTTNYPNFNSPMVWIKVAAQLNVEVVLQRAEEMYSNS